MKTIYIFVWLTHSLWQNSCPTNCWSALDLIFHVNDVLLLLTASYAKHCISDGLLKCSMQSYGILTLLYFNWSLHCKLVSWYFELSQPQRVTSWLKTMFNLSSIYSARKSSNHKLSINHKISHDTNLHKTKHTQNQTQNFRRISPFGITPVEKAHKARTRWYRGPFRRFINTRFFFKV